MTTVKMAIPSNTGFDRCCGAAMDAPFAGQFQRSFAKRQYQRGIGLQ